MIKSSIVYKEGTEYGMTNRDHLDQLIKNNTDKIFLVYDVFVHDNRENEDVAFFIFYEKINFNFAMIEEKMEYRNPEREIIIIRGEENVICMRPSDSDWQYYIHNLDKNKYDGIMQKINDSFTFIVE